VWHATQSKIIDMWKTCPNTLRRKKNGTPKICMDFRAEPWPYSQKRYECLPEMYEFWRNLGFYITHLYRGFPGSFHTPINPPLLDINDVIPSPLTLYHHHHHIPNTPDQVPPLKHPTLGGNGKRCIYERGSQWIFDYPHTCRGVSWVLRWRTLIQKCWWRR
jgi:hypothetical protein